MDATPPPEGSTIAAPRRRVRITLRVLMVVVLGLGLWLGWRVHLAREQREAVAAVKALGGTVAYDWELDESVPRADRRPWAPAWLRKAIGDEYFQDVERALLVNIDEDNMPAKVQDGADLAPILRKLPRLKHLEFMGTNATDSVMEVVGGLRDLEELRIETFFNWKPVVTEAGVAKLAGLSKLKLIHMLNAKLGDESLRDLSALPMLETMSLQGNNFTDAGVAHIRGMTTLTGLYIETREMTDAALVHLQGLKNLDTLNLQYTKVTDEGLKQLKGLTKLTTLFITHSAVTDEGKAWLREHMPNLTTVQ